MTRPGRTVAVVAALALSLGTAASTGSLGSAKTQPSSRKDDLGAVPIPTAPPVATAIATTRKPALLEMGAPLRVVVDGVTASVTATGPVQATEYDGLKNKPTRTAGTFTVAVRPTSGTLSLASSDFSSRDETGTAVGLHSVGVGSIRATPAHPANLRLRGTYGSGAAQLTWRRDGRTLAVWDFNIELD